MTDKRVRDMAAASALGGTEKFYADDGSSDVYVTAQQIKTFSAANVANIAALRALTVVDPDPVVHVLGYYSATLEAPPDGGGGFFNYVASDVTSDDNDGTIIVDASGRRWYRQFDGGKINIKWFGAVADGSFESPHTGTDNTAAIQATINFCATRDVPFNYGRPQLYVPAGGYRITGLLTVTSVLNWTGDSRERSFGGQIGSNFIFDHALPGCIDCDTTDHSGASHGQVTDMGFASANPTVAVEQHCFRLIAGGTFNAGIISRVSFEGFTGFCIYLDAPVSSYIQASEFNGIWCSNVGGFFSIADTITSYINTTVITNFDLENGVNQTVRQHAFFDFLGGSGILINGVVYEGGASTEVIFRFGGAEYLTINGVYTEQNNTPHASSFIEVSGAGSLGGIGLVTIRGLILQESFTSFTKFDDDVSGGTVIIADGSGQATTIDYGTGIDNRVIFDSVPTRPLPVLSNLLSDNTYALSYSDEPRKKFRYEQLPETLFHKAGAWFASDHGGMVSFDASDGSIANIGMYDDADQGRVFELVSTANNIPAFKCSVQIPAGLVELPYIVVMRYYVESSQPTMLVFPFDAIFPNNSIAENEFINSGHTLTTTEVLPHNTWRNGFLTVQATDTSLIDWGFRCPDDSPVTPSGVTKIRIASIYVGTGYGAPALTSGGFAGKPIEWWASAAPTYGSYYVGDRVWNTNPASGGPPGYVCTTAGSPGTWKAMANLA